MKKILILLALAAVGITQADEMYSDITVSENGTRDFDYLTISKGTLTNNGQVSANQIYVANGDIVNNGTMTDKEMNDDFIMFANTESRLTNNGRIDGYVSMIYGSLEMNDGSYIQKLDVYDGVSVYVNGNVSMEYLYLGDDTELIFGQGSSIDLGGGDLQFYNVNLVYVVDSDLVDGDTDTDYSNLLTQGLFTNFVDTTWSGDGAVGFTNDAVITLRDSEGDEVTRTYREVCAAVPEPTTATLSLLALCGLAARRRRK